PYRNFGYRYPFWNFGYGYPYWGYGSAWNSGLYPFGAYGSYPYGDYYSDFYPYDLGYSSTYPDYGVAPPDYSDYGVNPPLDQGYSAAPYTESTTSRITITAPPGAEIWVEGVKIASGSGAVHTFQTPRLNSDQQYRYKVRAVWTGSDGRTVEQ